MLSNLPVEFWKPALLSHIGHMQNVCQEHANLTEIVG